MTDDLSLFRQVLREFLDRNTAPGSARSANGQSATFDRSAWRVLCNQLGLPGLAVPEEYGGQGFGLEALAVACHELGRTLYGTPVFSSVILGTNALLEAASSRAKTRLLPLVTAGSQIITLGLHALGGDWDPAATPVVHALAADESCHVSGNLDFVPDASTVDLILAASRGSDARLALVGVRPTAPGVIVDSLPCVDRSQPLARVQFDAAEAEILSDRDVGAALRRAHLAAILCLAAEAVGGTERLTEMATDYAKKRFAFGRPIGSFQAVKHRCAEMWLAQTAAATLVRSAAREWDADDPQAEASIHLSKAIAADGYLSAAMANIVVRGALGFTWEDDAHLYLRRAKAIATLLGTSEQHLLRASDLVLG